MFLDDKLYEIGHKLNLKYPSEKQAKKLMVQMAKEAVKHCHDAMDNPPKTERQVWNNIAIVKRTDRSWRMAAERLEKEGRGMVAADGFKDLIAAMDAPWPEYHKNAFKEKPAK